ncbi:MAG: HNH endonuclease [Bacteroidota bacterium]
MTKKNWTREEHIVAFNLYCKTPFNKINSSNPAIKETAGLIGRSVGSVAMKLANFARLDPALQARNISGLTQGAKGEEEVWKEFHGNWDELAWSSEEILAKYKGASIESSIDRELNFKQILETEKDISVKARVNQGFFRKMILASYNSTCCITNIDIPELLIASHIIPWSVDSKNRVNPANGLCLNSLHDKAFDRGFISISPEYKVLVSKELKRTQNRASINSFLKYEGQVINLPKKFLPSSEFLNWHNRNVFKNN